MKIARFIKKSFCAVLSVSVLFAFCACSEANYAFIQTENGNLLSVSGTEYGYLAGEDDLYYLGELVFQGGVKGEEETSMHLVYSYQTGLFSIKDDEVNNVLIRQSPDSEWFSIYRKTSLPVFDFSADNCIRLELVEGVGPSDIYGIHTTCGDGITNKSEIAEFLADVGSQQDPDEAGLYDLITGPDGRFENCRIFAMVLGFFEDEPNLAIRMPITSYNDLAYSISIEEKEYVLPAAWLERLQNS